MESSGTPSWHKHGVGIPLPCERSQQHERSECQGKGWGRSPHYRKSERKEGSFEGEEQRRKERKDLDEFDSTPDLANAEGLTVEELTSLLAEGVQE
jgi:hypothetical protein